MVIFTRLQNVKSPQKRQGPTPERGHAKKRRHIDFSSDKGEEDYDADSSGGSTIILYQTSGSSDDGPSLRKWTRHFSNNDGHEG